MATKKFDDFQEFIKYILDDIKESNNKEKDTTKISSIKDSEFDKSQPINNISKLFTYQCNEDNRIIKVIAPFVETDSININIIDNNKDSGEVIVIQFTNNLESNYVRNFIIDSNVTVKVNVPEYILKKTIETAYENGMIIIKFKTQKSKLNAYKVQFKK